MALWSENPIHKLVDLVFPPRCPVCEGFLPQNRERETGPHFCRACFSDFREIVSPVCPICGIPFTSRDDEDHPCEDCMRKKPMFESACARYLFDGPMMEAVHQFKYGGKRFLADSLGSLLADRVEKFIETSRDLVTVPVPLHVRRLRERGFNQSLLLARHVAQKLNTNLDFSSLKRIRYTSPQTGLGKKERKKNVKGAFEIKTPKVFEEKTVLLVDDVFTTGSTLNECARILHRAGCRKVLCLTLARAARL